MNDRGAEASDFVAAGALPPSGAVPVPPAHAPGVYFGLPAHEYHADPGLGSGDVRQLRRNPASYWYGSHMNPHRPPDRDTPSRMRGRALHTLVYEGEQLFDAMYCRGPDQDANATPAEKSAVTKEAKRRAQARGLALLDAEDYDRIAIANHMITQNPHLNNVFSGGASEVSIFWTEVVDGEDVRLKARLDYLKVRSVGDLKSVANIHDMEFPQACINAVATYRYDMQAVHYLRARALLPRLIADGAVHGDHDPEWLGRVAAAPRWGWVWIFYQVEGAPITWSSKLSLANPLCDVARHDVDVALKRFVDYRRTFGTDQWLLIEPTHELFLEDMPAYYARSRQAR